MCMRVAPVFVLLLCRRRSESGSSYGSSLPLSLYVADSWWWWQLGPQGEQRSGKKERKKHQH